MNAPITSLSQNYIRHDNGNSLLGHLTIDETNVAGDTFMMDITNVSQDQSVGLMTEAAGGCVSHGLTRRLCSRFSKACRLSQALKNCI